MAGLNFQHYKGDTFDAVNFQYKVNGTAVDITDYVIRMQLREQCGGLVKLDLTSVEDTGITITDAVNGRFKINEQVIDIDEGNYLYDIQFTTPTNQVRTWIRGEFLIECDITRAV